ncbi:MAG: DUF2142 domain-containing protein [Roseburia sp.]|nr:DUF2142 domain-containing protein [Roseburia sp.]
MDRQVKNRLTVFLCMEAVVGILYFLYWESGLKEYALPYRDMFFKIYLLLMILSMIGICYWWLCREGKIEHTLERRFAVMLFLTGMMFNIVLPAFSAPDEGVHFASAYRISNIMMGKNMEDSDGHIYVRREDRDTQVFSYEKETYAEYFRELFKKANSEEMVVYEAYFPEKTVPFTTYFIPAAGMTLARVLNLNGRWLMILARIFNFLFFCIAAARSLKWMPYGKRVIMVLCQIPMTVELVSSISYDSVNLAFILLFVSFVMHCAYDREKVTWKEFFLMVIMGCCFAPIKLVYIPFLLLILFIPVKKVSVRWKYQAAYAGVLVLPILISVYLKLGKVAFIASDTTNLTAKQGYSLSYLLHHPLDSLFFLIYSMSLKRGDETLDTFMGKSLGWLDVKIPRHFLLVFLFLLVLYVLGEESRIVFSRWQKILVGEMIAFGVSAPILVMFLAETDLVEEAVACVQGRYFLPLVLLFPIVAQNRKVTVQTGEEPSMAEAVLFYMNMLTVIFVLFAVWKK